MALIHHVVTGQRHPPLVFVHGFGCAHADWDSQVAHFSPRHRTVAVDLRGHGESPGSAAECSIERYGADVADVMRALALPASILVGHSMGCRVVIEAALQAPSQTLAVILVDGSQFSAAMEAVLQQRFAAPNGYAVLVTQLFQDMFTDRSDGVRGGVDYRTRKAAAAADRGEDAGGHAALRRWTPCRFVGLSACAGHGAAGDL